MTSAIQSGDAPRQGRRQRRAGPVAALGRLIRRLLLTVVLLVLALLAPVAYVETMCRPGEQPTAAVEAILPPEHHRPESNTLLTYPEWHIVHAYADYAAVIRRGAPHDYAYLPAVGQYWTSLCALTRASGPMGGPSDEYRLMTHVIGVSFTAELLLKAAYEETVGRLFVWLRGPRHAPLDKLSAQQAAAYAAFLRQTPWYRWDFLRDARALGVGATESIRDRERAVALGLEYRAKALYARAIAQGVAATGADELTMRSVIGGVSPGTLAGIEGVSVITERPEGVEVETPRYAEFTRIAREVAAAEGDFVEIAGNDEILVTSLASEPRGGDLAVISVMPRQGNPGVRELRLLRVDALADLLRDPGVEVEHVHDY